jgi:hypothetical protein
MSAAVPNKDANGNVLRTHPDETTDTSLRLIKPLRISVGYGDNDTSGSQQNDSAPVRLNRAERRRMAKLLRSKR